MDLSLDYARQLDNQDELSEYKQRFHFPEGEQVIYLNGNSLGLQPRNTKSTILRELDDWKKYGVEGHFEGDSPWLSYHERLTEPMAKIVGAKPLEVVVMNTLTVNLHLMMVSFYRPTPERHKILIEYSPFPSDIYAIKSQIEFHGYNPEQSIIELKPERGEIVSEADIEQTLDEHGDEIALILIGGVNYYTGQVYPMEKITELGHKYGCLVGFDLAHAVGNVELRLHEWNVDFAVWCTYKYLNSGPGSIGGCFVHERFADDENLPRFAGWWGHDKETRFLMKPEFQPIKGAEGWQLSNPPIFSLAVIEASLQVFDEVGMDKLLEKSNKMIQYARGLIGELCGDKINILTPKTESMRGCQLSLSLKKGSKPVYEEISAKGVVCDWREPNVIRVAFVPLYNSFEDVWKFVKLLSEVV